MRQLAVLCIDAAAQLRHAKLVAMHKWVLSCPPSSNALLLPLPFP